MRKPQLNAGIKIEKGEESLEIGTVAGLLTTGAFIPQVIRIYRTKDVGAISASMYYVQIAGFVLWILHGLVRKDTTLIVANVITLLLALSILFAKIKYNPQKKNSML